MRSEPLGERYGAPWSFLVLQLCCGGIGPCACMTSTGMAMVLLEPPSNLTRPCLGGVPGRWHWALSCDASSSASKRLTWFTSSSFRASSTAMRLFAYASASASSDAGTRVA